MRTRMVPHAQRSAPQPRDRAEVLADLRQRFVALPDPNNASGWLLDLRDPFHPVIDHYETWAAAEDAANASIARCLRESVVDGELSTYPQT